MTPLLLCLWTYQEAYIEILLSCDKFVTFKSMPNSRLMCPCPNSFCGNFLFPFQHSSCHFDDGLISTEVWTEAAPGASVGGGHPLPSSTACERTHPLPASPCHKSQHGQYKKDAASATIERSVLTCSHAYPATQAPSYLLASYLFLFEGLTNSKLNTLLPN